MDGKMWKTNEHYFQSQKFAGTEYEEKVRCQSTPWKAAKMGRRRSLPLRKDWAKVKESIMYKALKAKFTQHPNLKKILLGTGCQTIIEKTTSDYYWGCGTKGNGQNRLGVLLMKLRDEL